MELLQNFYETTLDALRDAKNERLWFKTMTKLGKLYFDRCATCGSLSFSADLNHFMICPVKPHTFCHFLNLREEFNRLARILKQLRQSCQTEEGEDDLKKGTQLLEVIKALSSEAFLNSCFQVYALEIQMYTAQKNNKKLKALYDQSLHIKSAIPHPLILGVIRWYQETVSWPRLRLKTLQGVRREDALARRRIWESSHRLLWGENYWWFDWCVFFSIALAQSFTSRLLRIMMNRGHLAEPHASNTWVRLSMELA